MDKMEDIFITDIEIKKIRHLKDLKIHISDTERKHLILTGKNGSGKTSVLENLKEHLLNIENESFENFNIIKQKMTKKDLKLLDDEEIIKLSTIVKKLVFLLNSSAVFFNQKDITNLANQFSENFILSYFPSKRPLENMQIPKGVEKLELKENTNLNEKLNIHFLQYIVNKINDKAQYFMKNEINKANEIQKWFDNFEGLLKKIFNDETLKLNYDVENKNFYIHQKNRESYDFNSFSDGYKSILAIVSEIIMQSDINKKSYEEVQGIVLIDEVETHLHLELQKQILPFLTTLFPKIQFIVTTHSPFVLNSIENAVVYDLEKQEEIDSSRLKNASYSQIVKNYFEIDSEYSKILEKKIEKYEKLVKLFEEENLNEESEKELFELDIELDKLSPMLSDEIYLRFKEAQEKILDND